MLTQRIPQTALYRDSFRPICAAGCLVSLISVLQVLCERLILIFVANCSKDAPDPSLRDAVCAIIYAAPHTELKGRTVHIRPVELTTHPPSTDMFLQNFICYEKC